MAKNKPVGSSPAPASQPTPDEVPDTSSMPFEPDVKTEEPPAPLAEDTPAIEPTEPPTPEPPAPPAGIALVDEPTPVFDEGETIVVNRLGLYRVLIALITDKDAYSGVGARRAFKEIFQVEDEALQARWEHVKSFIYGGPNNHKIA